MVVISVSPLVKLPNSPNSQLSTLSTDLSTARRPAGRPGKLPKLPNSITNMNDDCDPVARAAGEGLQEMLEFGHKKGRINRPLLRLIERGNFSLTPIFSLCIQYQIASALISPLIQLPHLYSLPPIQQLNYIIHHRLVSNLLMFFLVV